MRKLLLICFLSISSFLASSQEQISNKMTISIEGSSSIDFESLYGGGLKIDRKINNNFSIGLFSSVYLEFVDRFYYSDGDISVVSDDGKRVVYQFNKNAADTLGYGGYLGLGSNGLTEEIINLQIGIQLKYRLFSHKATKPYLGFNLSYNNQLPIKESESVSINRIPSNNGILASLELGIDHEISNRFSFFINVRASLFTNLVYNEIETNILSVEETPDKVIDNDGFIYTVEGYGIDSATFEEISNQNSYPSFFVNAGISYKIY